MKVWPTSINSGAAVARAAGLRWAKHYPILIDGKSILCGRCYRETQRKKGATLEGETT